MQDIRDWNFLESHITDLPSDYFQIKDGILDFINGHLYQVKEIDKFLYKSIEDMRSHWKRKHVFYLVRDLLEHNRDDYENFDETLLEIDSFLTGFCNPLLIYPFANEEKYLYDLTGYVRSNIWIDG